MQQRNNGIVCLSQGTRYNQKMMTKRGKTKNRNRLNVELLLKEERKQGFATPIDIPNLMKTACTDHLECTRETA